MYEIEKNIPIPESKTGFMRSLEINQAFIMPLSERSGLSQLAKQAGIKVKSKKLDKEFCRVWRTA